MGKALKPEGEGPDRVGLGALAFGHFCVDMQTSALAVLIPILYVTFNLDYAMAAIIITVNSLASSVIQPLFGLLSDRKSLRVFLPVGCVVAATGILLVTFAPSYWVVLLVVLFSGLGSASFHPEGSRNANYVSGAKKATGLSVFFVGGNLGYAVGPILITTLFALFGKAGAFGMLVPAAFSSLILWRLLPVYAAAAQVRESNKTTRAIEVGLSRGRIAYSLSLLISIISFRSMVQTGLVTFIPLYFVTTLDTSRDYAAFLLTVFSLAGAVGTLVGGRLGDRMERKLVLAVSVAVVTPALLVFLNTTGIIQIISLAIAGATLISASSLTVVMAQEILPNRVGLASGLTLGLAFGAGGLGATALGKYADIFGLSQTMLLLVFIPLPVVILSLILPTAKPASAETGLPVEQEAHLAKR
jgi:MFS transporter, FSR family, fosmidomycin resistance protein